MKTKGARTNARVKDEEAALARWLDMLDRERAAGVVAYLLDPEGIKARAASAFIGFMSRHRAYLVMLPECPAANPRFQVCQVPQY